MLYELKGGFILKRYFAFLLCFVILAVPFKANGSNISALSYIVYSPDTDEVVLEKDSEKRLPMASTTKIMTALIVLEYIEKYGDKLVSVTHEMCTVEGSALGLNVGDKINLSSLVKGMLLASGNDAANTSAIFISGSTEGFVKLMNNKAKEYKLYSTSFETPSGLDGENHYSSAKDLALLSAVALENNSFREIVKSKSLTIEYYSAQKEKRIKVNLKNHNKLLVNLEGCIGIKTGYTKKSGRCLVSAVERDGRRLIAVTLNAPDDWRDHTQLYLSAYERLRKYTPDDINVNIYTASGERIKIKLKNKMQLSFFGEGKIQVKIYLPRVIYYENIEKCGKIYYILNGKIIGTDYLGL